MKTLFMDVYFEKPEYTGAYASIIRFEKEWDDTLTAHTNINITGQRRIQWTEEGTFYLDGHMINGGGSMADVALLNERYNYIMGAREVLNV